MDWDFMLNHRKNSWSKPYPQRLFGSIATATIQWHVLKRRAMMHSYTVKWSYASEGMYVCPRKFIHWDARNIWCLRNICTVKYVHLRKVCTVKYVAYNMERISCGNKQRVWTVLLHRWTMNSVRIRKVMLYTMNVYDVQEWCYILWCISAFWAWAYCAWGSNSKRI